MQLRLENITKVVQSVNWISKLNLAPVSGSVSVLLGATQAGKTTLMRVMAGLDAPSSGRVWVDSEDVTNVHVKERNVSMVYQQFINYPTLTVFDNIAMPLKLKGQPDIDKRVISLAERLHITPYLARYPSTLSGGQQQRVALARALAKNTPLTLLDEPLVNLDYKLREGLRDELGDLFKTSQSTVIYATTEPSEALLLGGYTAVMDEGELLQYGPANDVFLRPASLRVAKAFSDPPMNVFEVKKTENGFVFKNQLEVHLGISNQPTSDLSVGVRATSVYLSAHSPADVCVDARVELAEISGSDTYLHFATPIGPLVCQLPGVHTYKIADQLPIYLSPDHMYLFGADGALIKAPTNLLRDGNV